MWKSTISLRVSWFQTGTCFLMWFRLHFIFGVIQRWICWHHHVPINVYRFSPWKVLCLGVECFQPSLYLQDELWVCSCISSTSSVQLSGRHVSSHLRLLILVAHCCMEVPRLLRFLNMFADVACWCPLIQDLVMGVSCGWVLKGMQSLHLTLWLLRDMCCTDKGSHPLSGGDRVNSSICDESLPKMWERIDQTCACKGVPNNAISSPKLADFWFTYLGFAYLGALLVFIILLFLHFFRRI